MLKKKSKRSGLLYGGACVVLLISAWGVAAPTGTARCLINKLNRRPTKAENAANEAAASAAAGDIARFHAGTSGVPVKTTPVTNQGPLGDCWAQTLTVVASSEHLAQTGEVVKANPMHNLFYNFYYQILGHKQYFGKLPQKILELEKQGLTHAQAVDKVEDDVVRLMRLRPGSREAIEAGWVPDEGSDEPLALEQAKIIGLVPTSAYPNTVTAQSGETAIQSGLKKVISAIVSNPSKIAQYKTAPAADGIIDSLYNDLATELKPVFGQPFRPQQVLPGTSYNPLTFMSQGLGFDPTKWVDITMTDATVSTVNQAIQASLKGSVAGKSHPVGIGFDVIGQQKAEATGVFDPSNIQPGEKAEGGHEITIMNTMAHSDGSAPDYIAQNSWGTDTGLTATGQTTPPTSGQGGFYGITNGPNGYIPYLCTQGACPDFMIHSSVASQFPGMQTTKSVNKLRRAMAG